MRIAGFNRVAFVATLVAWACGVDAANVELTGVVQLDSRGNHACVVTTGGGVKCWGSDGSGQLGSGSAGGSRPIAADVVGLTSGVTSVATSTGSHTCAVMDGGSVKCWGYNAYGQLGDGTQTDRSAPVDVQGLPWPAVALTAGDVHTCAMSAGGQVACWGDNLHGQLGDGTTTGRISPTAVIGVVGAAALSAAGVHTCAIVGAGAVKCWGSNNRGQLGDGTTTLRSTPVDVIGVSGATQLATSGHGGAEVPDQGFSVLAYGRSCAIVAGVGKCWSDQGLTDAGFPAGFGSLSQSAALTRFSSCMACYLRHDHACMLTPAGGVQCAGSDYWGLIGGPTAPVGASLLAYPYLPPTDVVGLSSDVIAVSAGPLTTCALLASERVKCWGRGEPPTTVLTQGTYPQAISFSTPLSLPVGGTADLSSQSAGNSGSPVIYTILTPSTCSYSPGPLTGIAVGTCTIAANQAGSIYYDPAPQVTHSFPVDTRLTQTISFSSAPNSITVNGVATVSAVATSGLPVTFTVDGIHCSISGNVVTGLRLRYDLSPTAVCNITATQPGNSTYAPARPFVRSVSVVANAGTLGLVIYKSGGGTGTVTSSTPGIDCGASCAGNFAVSSGITLTAVAGPGSTFGRWTGACTGNGPCVVTMDALKSVGARFESDVPRPVNISTRGVVGTGNDVMIGGFVITGSANKRVAIVATGPSLSAFGIQNPLSNPTLTLVRSSDQAVIATNDDWQQATNSTELAAMGFAPANAGEAAILIELAPGAYTTIVQGMPAGATGIGVVGVYEIDGATVPISNLSTRGQVLTGEGTMIAGFVIGGSGPQTVAIVATGPSLAQYGITNPLTNPSLTLVRSADQAVIETNDDWQSHANAAQLQAAGFAPPNSLESAIYVTLQPGAYTAIVQGVGGGTGTAVIGVYKVN